MLSIDNQLNDSFNMEKFRMQNILKKMIYGCLLAFALVFFLFIICGVIFNIQQHLEDNQLTVDSFHIILDSMKNQQTESLYEVYLNIKPHNILLFVNKTNAKKALISESNADKNATVIDQRSFYDLCSVIIEKNKQTGEIKIYDKSNPGLFVIQKK